MNLDQYIANINQRYKLGNATEHTFRGDLQQLIESLVPGIAATNEPKRQSCGAPDYILTRKDIPVGFIEAKDLGDKDLAGTKKTGNKEQFDRYKASLNNLIFTDYLDFQLYREGIFVTGIAIGEIINGSVVPKPENFAAFTNLLRDFCNHIGQTIKSPKKLAEMMAAKARLLADVIASALTSDETRHENSTLKEQMTAFKEILIHDITPKGFADVYAQTIAYGMFAARLHDPTLPTFSRQEAAELIPKSNPFLRKLFGYIAGPDIDDRIKWIVDSLVEIFLACNVEEILKNYGKATKTEDPIIHFYETFLSEYDPKLRKARGVWYTPQPVVNFIVRAVDDILKTEFNLKDGLADTSKTTIKRRIETKATADRRSKITEAFVDEEVHKVQILDPATGTGTFLAEVVKHIHKKFAGQQGIWSNYVENHLLPRLNGFELLMASYAMAHLKLDLLFTETGFKPASNQRLRVYLTNSLEEHHPDTGTLFANWLSSEANEANHIKRDTPVMCVIGNPPYSISSSNKGKWISNLINVYKEGLKEKTINALSDDYVKFIRFAHSFIEKNGCGIIAMITNNSFIDGIIFSGMRKSLFETFDKIYIYNLHGNSKIKESCDDGSIDENVFDIQPGVSINLFIKTEGSKKEKQVRYYSSQGKRNLKYDKLLKENIGNVDWQLLDVEKPHYYFVPVNFGLKEKYDEYFSVQEIFNFGNSGIETRRDNLTIQFSFSDLDRILDDFKTLNADGLKSKYQIPEDGRDWKINDAKTDLIYNRPVKSTISYRPFDNRFTLYTGKVKGFMGYPVYGVMKHIIGKENESLIIGRQGQVVGSMPWNLIYISKSLTDRNIYYRGGCMIFPLYLYPETNGQQSTEGTAARTPNLNPAIVKGIAQKLGLAFVPEKTTPNPSLKKGGELSATENLTPDNEQPATTFAPIDLLDYIYAVLHSPTYREKYKEFLKIDFPRVPYPANPETFWQLVNLGSQLRQLHLLESPETENYITQYPIDGSNAVEKIRFEENYDILEGDKISMIEPTYEMGRVYINEAQFFQMVPKNAWEFYIGGYQPAQKWLKDRKGRQLNYDDILHYQKIIVALTKTAKLMQEIDTIEIEG